jgi:DNA-binding XRE family transcriptional regulator
MNTKKIFGTEELDKMFGRLTFARLLKAHRLGEELSQVELAKILGMSKQSLNDLENGRKIPSIKRGLQIAKKINVIPELAVQVILQDQVDREHLKLKVSVTQYKKAS